jgi:general secretion pathway protein K
MRKRRGVALITVLLILVLITPILTYISLKLSIGISRTTSLNDVGKITSYALAVETWARSVLLEDARLNKYDTHAEPWAQKLPLLVSDGVTISGQIRDLQGKFNLNTLPAITDSDIQKYWLRLLEVNGIDMPRAIALTQAIADWVDADSNTRLPFGAEDHEYLVANPPYRTANQRMFDLSELKLIKGVNEALFNRLSRFTVVLPESNIQDCRININTASVEVLKALFPVSDWNSLEQRFNERLQKPFYTLGAFKKLYKRETGRPINVHLEEILDVKSRYFLLDAVIGFGEQTVRIQSLIKRSKRDVVILGRNFS